MPLLPLEPFLYPDDLFGGSPVGGDDGEWWVLHTRPRAEKALARRLGAAGTAFFLPLFNKQWLSNGRTQTAHHPLFPGYVFVHGDVDARVRAFETNLVAGCLRVADQGRLQAELAGIHRLMTASVPLTPEQQLVPGARVVVMDGPFAGLTGRLLRRGSQDRLVVEVGMLNQGVSVDLARWMVRPAEEVNTTAERLRVTMIRGR